MAYTDVDRLILNRWDEVVALRGAFEELLDRMEGTVEGALSKAARWAHEQGLKTLVDAREPVFEFWKPEWANRRDHTAVSFKVGEFTPIEYGKVENDHPWLWVITEDPGAGLKFDEETRVRFARQLRIGLGANASHWDDPDTIEAEEPFGRYANDITDSDRVRWMSQPEELTAFLIRQVQEAMTIAPAIDAALAAVRKA